MTHTHADVAESTIRATRKAELSGRGGDYADAYALMLADRLGVARGKCFRSDCVHPARDFANVLPAREDGLYVGQTVPTCKSDNDAAETLGAAVLAHGMAVRETVLSLDYGTVRGLAETWRAERDARYVSTFTIG